MDADHFDCAFTLAGAVGVGLSEEEKDAFREIGKDGFTREGLLATID